MPAPMNDLLTDADLAAITGIPDRAHQRVERMTGILRQAGIYFWLRGDGSIATTWTHVHRAGEAQPGQNKPRAMPQFQNAS